MFHVEQFKKGRLPIYCAVILERMKTAFSGIEINKIA